MIDKILVIEDVRKFAKQLIVEGLSFHPDDDFNDYVNLTTNTPTYSKEEADLRNKLMNQCFDVCDREGVDIYQTMMEEFILESDLHKIITASRK